MPNRHRRRAALAATLSALAVLALGACESGSDHAAPEPAPTGTAAAVLAPGRPGEPARRISPEEAASLLPDERPNGADFRYVQMMVVHHRQALTMTALAPSRAGSPGVKKVAERIAAAQQPEIGAMEGWLTANGGPRDQGAHDHHAMPGMATEAQLGRLKAAEGAAFDELFLELMVRHHEGAVTMAAEVLGQGNNIQVEEMANDVIAQQTAEINRMRSL
ncbi:MULTISPECIES: DUF305 domain-containing protein [unclassified Streptomyces]|uniref:DUF305 domain-containing protein n=1 Tax=unclassified Streptomyces TaxID=2593676 RepID=UPI001F0D3A4F|nr:MULTISPECIES: DUF305 domain-containing protein [unclassified Streptomyces]